MTRTLIGWLVIGVCSTTAAAAETEGEIFCGSPEKFEAQPGWKALPGCSAYDHPDENAEGAALVLNNAKYYMRAVLDAYDAANWDEVKNQHYANCISGGGGGRNTWSSDPELAAAKPAYDAMCTQIEGALKQYERASGLMHEIELYYQKLSGSPASTIPPEDIDHIRALLDRADAEGIPRDWRVSGSDGSTPTLENLRAALDPAREKIESARAASKAARDAKFAPYARVGGDRVAYVERFLGGIVVYGPGGETIEEPDEFAEADALYLCSVDRNYSPPVWEVEGTHFEGDKKVGPTYVATGVGSACPSSAFK
jgi:hypothetical protein